MLPLRLPKKKKKKEMKSLLLSLIICRLMLSYPSIIPLQAYVTKDGKELTGRTAYRHYRKVHLKTSFIDDFGVHFMSPNRLKTLAGYRRVVQGLRSPKRKLVPGARREKAEARCSR